MNELEIIKKVYSNIKKTKDVNYRKTMLYSVYSFLLLSTNYFHHNIDLKSILTPLLQDIDNIYKEKERKNKSCVFKDYVYKSRSQIVARFIRIIQKSDESVQIILINFLTRFIDENSNNYGKSVSDKSKKVKKDRPNSVDELLSRFGRY
ncbi:hypothetical protein GYV61_02045 [Lactobacillus melliventris]|uniref:hypothetical protein n=1 Tax=Lactobacillus melliventris TaxID=1218507 RepID=UPI00157FED6C|nr:hypothetical protein [Lactobacillus melliventris]NUE97527.1 hypothetical protein [Lactobacillus melliventris]